jgi:multimeric flavodoxin WrbA
MQITAINGGPRRGRISKTTMLLEAFLSGCRQEGAEVETINLREKDIKMCTGCYSCWIKTPGECAQKDDMRDILLALDKADVEVWATPLYFFGPTAMFKNFLDRTIPLAEPYIIEKDGLCTHPLRNKKARQIVFISVAGFCEMEHFHPMSQWLRFMEGRGLLQIRAEIYRPSAEFMSAPPLKEKVEEILAAARKAGQEFMQTGNVSEKTMQSICQDIMPDKETYMDLANKYWDWEIQKAQKRRSTQSEV